MLATYTAKTTDGRTILEGTCYNEFIADLLLLAPAGEVAIESRGRVVARLYDAQITYPEAGR